MTEAEREQILAEIDALAGVPEMLPTDITVKCLAERWGKTSSTVVARMSKLVESGQYESLLVYNPAKGRTCRVFRKVE
jgi:hypothetical protein